MAAAKLRDFSEALKKMIYWDHILDSLRHNDPDNDYWPVALVEINRMDGKHCDENALWNMAIDWWNQYGKAIA